MLGHFTGDGRTFFRSLFLTRSAKGPKMGTDRQASKRIAPYRENYVHRILFFYARNSFESNDQGPAGPDPAGGPARPVQIQRPHVS